MSGDVLTQRRKSAEIGVVTQARLGDVCRIDTSISFPCEEEIWLLNLDMIEQQTGRVIQRIYVDRNALGGSTVLTRLCYQIAKVLQLLKFFLCAAMPIM